MLKIWAYRALFLFAVVCPQLHAQSDLGPPPTIVEESNVIWDEIQSYWLEFLQGLPSVIFGLAIFIVFYLSSRYISELMLKPLSYMSSSLLIRVVIRRIFQLLIILLGTYIFLRFAGLSEFAVAILSGTGVVGLIIGFAFKDIAENFISSLLLSIQKPFKIGDIIEVDNRIGVVKQVTARATTLLDFDGDHIQIPNSTVYKNVIRNVSANPNSRGNFVIGVGYDSSVVDAQKLAMTVLQITEAVLDDPEPQVLVDNLASSTINLKVYFWINTHQHSLLKVSSLLMRTILSEFEKAGISMPDDAREVIFPEGVKLIGAEQVISESQESQQSGQKTNKRLKKQESKLDNQSLSTRIESEEQGTEHIDDLSSDADTIREQANSARDPEQGQNIL
ncbi:MULTISPECIES: mechanosensitive ion channel family protein [Alteromonadaceae]|uniref:mechanosensitive ion channel family protein n=1 Tax=Alteromonadaceae TaxID=72275 RepID=UPI001C08D8CA|nr:MULTISPECIES: mechanosensitive ion channel family protein [Aliiglaciecola]MBU2877101.1 mechanosensitive ion channel family protein [Aliiglaciecola lipolytica]MDO6710180.1 mechanosensitive ion channel family protein [Aliiglaciecola sp. 2_MG-2023]MDO6751328.1 mechanosensitive ion channel family protein [Aliiglaciecola sp. 1_MG-2023]